MFFSLQAQWIILPILQKGGSRLRGVAENKYLQAKN